MRGRAAALALLALAVVAWAPDAGAAPGKCRVKVSAVRGEAPLRVTYRALCPSAAYRWSFGDGRSASGRTVTHVFRAGRYSPKLTTKTGRVPLPTVT